MARCTPTTCRQIVDRIATNHTARSSQSSENRRAGVVHTDTWSYRRHTVAVVDLRMPMSGRCACRQLVVVDHFVKEGYAWKGLLSASELVLEIASCMTHVITPSRTLQVVNNLS